MKFKTLILGISLITGLALTNAHAEDNSNEKKDIHLSKSTPHPGMNDDKSLEINVECTYITGMIHVEFLIPEGTSRLKVTDLTHGGRITEPIINGRHTTPIGCKAGTYQIEIETEVGIYTGFLILE